MDLRNTRAHSIRTHLSLVHFLALIDSRTWHWNSNLYSTRETSQLPYTERQKRLGPRYVRFLWLLRRRLSQPVLAQVGIHRMNRNHIHLAQGFQQDGVLSGTDILAELPTMFSLCLGIRRSSRVLIYIDVQKAIDSGIPFFLSKNKVVLTPGNEAGYLEPHFFHRVERVERTLTRLPLKDETEKGE